jgi:hypothetical protein
MLCYSIISWARSMLTTGAVAIVIIGASCLYAVLEGRYLVE